MLDLTIKECLNNVVALQQHSIVHKNAENLQKFDQKLMDLFILLTMWANDETELVEQRLELFLNDAKTKKS